MKKPLVIRTALLAALVIVLAAAPPLAAERRTLPYDLAEGTWGLNVPVSDTLPGDDGHSAPAIALDAAGNAYAVWEDARNVNGDFNYDIYFSWRPAGGAWQPNVRVNDDTGTRPQAAPSLAVDPAGNTYAVWIDFREAGRGIYFSCRPAGSESSWETNVKVSDDAGASYWGIPDIALDPGGNAWAVWADDRNGFDGISGYFGLWSARRPAGSSWQANEAVKLASEISKYFFSPSVAVDASGNAFAVWEDWNNVTGDSDVGFSMRPDGGAWGADERVNDHAGAAQNAYPQIALDAGGNALAVWADARNLPAIDIYGARRPAGGSWQANVKVNGATGTNQNWAPRLAVDGDGNAIAVWAGGNYFIHSSLSRAGGPWEPDIRVGDSATSAGWPAVALVGGAAEAVWIDTRNGYTAVFSASFLPNLAANGSFERGTPLPEGWTGVKLSAGDRTVAAPWEGEMSFKFAGSPSAKSLGQEVAASGLAGEAFTFSARSRARGVSAAGGVYLAQALFHYTDGTRGKAVLRFRKSTHPWELKSASFTTAKDYDGITLTLRFVRQTGRAWFDSVKLLRE